MHASTHRLVHQPHIPHRKKLHAPPLKKQDMKKVRGQQTAMHWAFSVGLAESGLSLPYSTNSSYVHYARSFGKSTTTNTYQ